MTIGAGATPPAGGQGGAGAAPPAGGAGATPPAGGAPAAGGTPPPAATDWTSGFSDADLKGYAQTKGWKDASEAVNSYRQFEKLQGTPQERILKLPEKPDDPAWADINFRLGVPKEAKEYQFEIPKENGDEAFANQAKEWFHKAGVPRTKAESIVKNWNEFMGKQITAQNEAYANQIKQEEVSLKGEWGAAHDQNREMALSAAKRFFPAKTAEGFDVKVVNSLQKSLGFANTIKFLHSLQAKIGEHPFVSGDQNGGNFGGLLSPAQAKAQIAMLMKDSDFTSRLMKKEAAATERWNSLNQMAAPQT